MNTKKNIILGVCGGISAYKSASLARLLTKHNYRVQVIMSESAKQFITPLTFQALTGIPVRDSLWDRDAEAAMGHIELARWADHIIIAPATAQVIAKLSQGMADDLLTTVCLASLAPIVLAPAMNVNMWHSPAVQENCRVLRLRNTVFLGPEEGEQACGDLGLGRMLEPDDIVRYFIQPRPLPLQGKRVLITAGPTREPIDPVRYLSNNSSGKMGYAFAQVAAEMGADVSLVSGPVSLAPPAGVTVVSVQSAQDMYQEVMKNIDRSDVFISCAAVTDYRCGEIHPHKLKKTTSELSLHLVQTQDILEAVGQLDNRPFVVGFAAETENLIANAKEKMKRKGCDFMVANDVLNSNVFGQDSSSAVLLTSSGQVNLNEQPKLCLAKTVLHKVADELSSLSVVE
jgi:phosphopantothenoylcysteine decarboxylase / phosphopantothenate---cysteine ligase